MKIQFSHWVGIAEIVSSIAVVVTLILLISTVREGTDLTRATMYESNINSLMEWRTEIVRDRDVARLLDAYTTNGFDSLDSIDRTRTIQLVANVFNVYEKAYFARGYGVLGESEWSRFQGVICTHYVRTMQNETLSSVMLSVMTEEFMSYLSSNCSE